MSYSLHWMKSPQMRTARNKCFRSANSCWCSPRRLIRGLQNCNHSSKRPICKSSSNQSLFCRWSTLSTQRKNVSILLSSRLMCWQRKKTVSLCIWKSSNQSCRRRAKLRLRLRQRNKVSRNLLINCNRKSINWNQNSRKKCQVSSLNWARPNTIWQNHKRKCLILKSVRQSYCVQMKT